MSDGKKFSAKALETAEERLTEIERKYSVIQVRIQAYDAVLSEFASLKMELRQLKSLNASLSTSLTAVTEELRLKVDTYGAQFQILHAKAESNSKALEDQKTYVNKFVSNSNKIFSDFSEVVLQIKEKISNVIAENKRIASSLPQHEVSLTNLNNSQLITKTAIDKLTEDHINFKDATADSQAATAKEQSKLAKSLAALPSLQEWANTLYARFQQDMGYRDKQATAYVDKKIDSLAKDFDSNPLSAESVKSALFNEIQTLALDGKNAYLKSNNCSQQLALVEKKLENLNLLFKKHQINN